MRRILLLPQAQDDLNSVQDPLFSRILQRLDILTRFPFLGPSLHHPFSGYRATVVDFFRIVYRITAKGDIEVAYVRHCSRRPPEAPL